jgi:hypothetical protein
MNRGTSRMTSLRRVVYESMTTRMWPVMYTITLLKRMSVSPPVKDAVTTRMHIPTAIPIPRRRFLRNCRTRLRTAMAATILVLLTREVMNPRLRFISSVP